jgi:putative salt-induced outer membrane protein YdiY
MVVCRHRIGLVAAAMLLGVISAPTGVWAQEQAVEIDDVREQSASVDFSFVDTSGNSETTSTSVAGAYSSQRGRWGLGLSATHLKYDFAGTTAAESSDVKARGSRVMTDRLAFLLIGSWERDVFKALDSRIVGGVGLLAQLVTRPRWVLTGTGAVGGTRERATGALDASSFLTLFGELDSTIQLSPTSSFTQSLTLRPGFQSSNSGAADDARDLLVDVSLALQTAVTSWLSVVLQYTLDHDTQPAAGKEKTDENITASLRLSWSRS